jgi:hypothetical protein
MTSHLFRLLRSITATGVAVVAVGTLAPAPATPPGDDVAPASSTVRREREGDCRVGPGEWSLKVRRESRSRIKIDFHIDEVVRRQRWQVFMGVDGRRIAAATRTSSQRGELQLERVTRNRRGHDRVAASAVNPRTGAVCNARMRF